MSSDAAPEPAAVEYSDYLLVDNDARFVLQLLLDAIENGAVAVSRLRLDSAERAGRGWRAEVTDRLTGSRHTVSATVLVNAAGPRAPELARLAGTTLRQALCFSKGAHIVVPRVTESGRVLAFFDDDQRLFYVIPMGHRSLIGTTDTRVDGADVSVTLNDRNFLLEQANSRLRLSRPLRDDDVIAYRCGVRPLVVGAGEDTDRLLFGPGRANASMPAGDSGTMSPDGPLASSDAGRDGPSAVR